MLSDEIENAQRTVRTDAYQMSIGEIVNMYEAGEIVINPIFQRLFRWDISQRTRLIESLLLGIPLPSIFVFERADGNWELVDGLQRLSTVLEFMGILKAEDGTIRTPSILEATTYLPSLYNTVWEACPEIESVPVAEQRPLDKSQQLAIKRGRLGVEILKRPSDDKTKFDLFQRLNAGGTQANAQELRNCLMIMMRPAYFDAVKASAENADLNILTGITSEQKKRQRHLELAVRFLVHVYIPYDGKLDVEEYIDRGIMDLALIGDSSSGSTLLAETFQILREAGGDDALKSRGSSGAGKAGLVGLEAIAVGVAKNLDAIKALGAVESVTFLRDKLVHFWQQPSVARFSSPGLRGTTRIQRTVPFGIDYFRP